VADRPPQRRETTAFSWHRKKAVERIEEKAVHGGGYEEKG
jgi:hypothetical protein